MQNMSYMQDYKRTLNPLQNYYTNATVDPKAAQIKKYACLHAESRVRRIFRLSSLSLSRRRSSSLSQALPVKPFRKLFPLPASMRTESTLTSWLRR